MLVALCSLGEASGGKHLLARLQTGRVLCGVVVYECVTLDTAAKIVAGQGSDKTCCLRTT